MNIHVLVFARPQKIGEVTRKNLDFMEKSAEALGHTIEIIHDDECHMKFGSKPELFIKNHDIKKIKVLIVKANPSGRNMAYRSAVIRQFELLGILVINKEQAVMKAKNKLRTLQVLTKKNVTVPKTYIVNHAQYIDDIIPDIGSFPVILKSVSGSHGQGVSIVESKRGLRSVIEMLNKNGESEPIIIQKYIKESKGRDIRVFIVGGRIIGAMERIATRRGEFRSNFHLGGRVKIAEMSPEEKSEALAAAAACGLDFAGVDVIRTNSGPQILEVNSNPGLEGITLATGRDIAGEIIKYAVEKTKKRRRKTKIL